MSCRCGTLLFVLSILLVNLCQGHLDEILKNYNTLQVRDINHSVRRRHVYGHEKASEKIISFDTLGRHFTLQLSPNSGLFGESFKAFAVDNKGRESEIPVDKESFYKGTVQGEKDSHANLHVDDDGVLTAMISTPNETYVIEPSWRHLNSRKFEMISYRHSDVKFNFTGNKTSPTGGKLPYGFCGHDSHHAKTLYSSQHIPDLTQHRARRDVMPTRVRCPLALVADYRFYEQMGQKNEKNTINYMIGVVDRVDQIYKSTVWDVNYGGFGFEIGQVIVHKESGGPQYNAPLNLWNIKKLLETFSYEKTWRDYCLAHLFTYQDFADGVIGLAYVGNAKRNAVGGICTEEYRTSSRTLYLNTGLSSSVNWGRRVLTEEADIVTAHEFGHNFGSEHDPEGEECAPDERNGGKFIMYPASVSGQRDNNKKFSPCSKRQVSYVLKSKSELCFKEPRDIICGNYKLEEGEECDPGNLGVTGTKCCTRDCKLVKDTQCSDGYDSPCCEGCQFKAKDKICRAADPQHCTVDTFCTGKSASCPPSEYQQDNYTCIEGGKCRSGKCVEFCITEGLEPCLCNEGADACRVCCQSNKNAPCAPWKNRTSGEYLTISDGRICRTGMCRQGKCEKTTQDVIERFWTLLTNLDVNTFVEFMRANIVGTILFFAACIWIPASCIVHRIDVRHDKEEQEELQWRDPKNTQLLRTLEPTSKGMYIYRQDSFTRPANPQKPLKLSYNYVKTRKKPNLQVAIGRDNPDA
ncbi:ADAM 17-like protease [Nematostella vectensis]|uniref:ADAM 17-like protease n=1 Tax=Nematostella vectensis TaxID=45351 RepID=UPI0020779921|nr:ADAM 17-like protease [Nematostella vectensis]